MLSFSWTNRSKHTVATITVNNNTMVAALEVNLTHVLYAWILVVGMLVAAILFLPPLIVPAKIDEPKRREDKKAE